MRIKSSPGKGRTMGWCNVCSLSFKPVFGIKSRIFVFPKSNIQLKMLPNQELIPRLNHNRVLIRPRLWSNYKRIKYETGSHQLMTVPDYYWITITVHD